MVKDFSSGKSTGNKCASEKNQEIGNMEIKQAGQAYLNCANQVLAPPNRF